MNPKYQFGFRSRRNLDQAHHDLQALFNEVIKVHDCAVICGHRNAEQQNKAYREGRSRLKYPDSKHNKSPSLAVDVIPWPVDWNDYKRFYYFGGIVNGIAKRMNLGIRWGGDWDGDNSFKDQNFNDLPHFELKRRVKMLKKNGNSIVELSNYLRKQRSKQNSKGEL